MEEPDLCQVCSDFEPQAWRKSLCRNCFHSLDEHSEEMLAAEGAALAKEKNTEKKEGQEGKPDQKKGVPASKVKDVAMGKDAKPPQVPVSKTSPDTKTKTKSSSSLSSSPASSHLKSPNKALPSSSSLPSLSVSQSSSLSSSTSTPSIASKISASSSSTSTTSTTATTSSTKPANTDSATNVSKAKSLTSKFESQSSKEPKPATRPSDIRLASSVSALTGKLNAESPSDTKATPTSGLSSRSKLSRPDTPQDPKPKSKMEEKSTPDRSTSGNETGSALGSKSSAGTTKGKGEAKPDEEKKNNDKAEMKDKKVSLFSSKLGEKDPKVSPLSKGSKAAPFGKDMLKSTKDALKKEKAGEGGGVAAAGKGKNEAAKTAATSLAKGKDGKDIVDGAGSAKPTGSVSDKDSTTRSTPLTDDDTGKKKEGKVGQTVMSGAPASGGGSPAHTRTNVTSKVEENKSVPGGQLAKNLVLQKGGGSMEPGKGSKVDGGGAEERKGPKETKHAKGIDDVTAKFQNTQDGAATPKGLVGSVGVKGQPSSAKVGAGGVGKLSVDEQRGIDLGISPSHVPGSASGLARTTNKAGSSETTATGATAACTDSTTTSVTITVPTPTPTTSAQKDSKGLSAFSKFKDFEKHQGKTSDKATGLSATKKLSSAGDKHAVGGKSESTTKATTDGDGSTSSHGEVTSALKSQLQEKENKLTELSRLLSVMEGQVKELEAEKETLVKSSSQSQKEDMEKLLQQLRGQLTDMEKQCSRLEGDNSLLTAKLREQEASVKRDQETRGKNDVNVDLEHDLELTEQELDEVKDENSELKREIMEMKNEMDEMYDTFRENEHDEFRELQKELELTAKNCRILQFKLRKAERRNEQIEEDRLHYEDKLRHLQDQFDSQDAKTHIRVLEEELRIAKEVSVRLHDELDIVEDKKNKALEDNRHLTELLEHTDKRQFRMEMEIDKLRDMVSDLKQQLKASRSSGNNINNNSINSLESSPDRKVLSTVFTRSID